MTHSTNIDKVAQVINEAWCDAQDRNEDGTAELFAQALSDAGLLRNDPYMHTDKIVDELRRTAFDADGWLSDAQGAWLNAPTDESYVEFSGEGSIDFAHVAEIVANVLNRGSND